MQQLKSLISSEEKKSRDAIFTVCPPYEAQIVLPNLFHFMCVVFSKQKRHKLLDEILSLK
jgi:hypothetical protein